MWTMYFDHIHLRFSPTPPRPLTYFPSSFFLTHCVKSVLLMCAWVWAIHWSMVHLPGPHPWIKWTLLPPAATTANSSSAGGEALEAFLSPMLEFWLAWSCTGEHSCHEFICVMTMSLPRRHCLASSSPINGSYRFSAPCSVMLSEPWLETGWEASSL